MWVGEWEWKKVLKLRILEKYWIYFGDSKLIFCLLGWCMLSILALIVTSLSTVIIHVHDWDLPVLWTPEQ
jgi:hypothetical protein